MSELDTFLLPHPIQVLTTLSREPIGSLFINIIPCILGGHIRKRNAVSFCSHVQHCPSQQQKGRGSPRVFTGSGRPCTEVVTHDFEQTLEAMISHHTVHGKTLNLQRTPCLLMGNTFVSGTSAIPFCRHTSFRTIPVKGHFDVENRFKWSK